MSEEQHRWLWNIEVDNDDAIRKIDEFIAASERARRTVSQALNGIEIVPPNSRLPAAGSEVVGASPLAPDAALQRYAQERMQQQQEALRQIQQMQRDMAHEEANRVNAHFDKLPVEEGMSGMKMWRAEINAVNRSLEYQNDLFLANAAVSQRIGAMNPAMGGLDGFTVNPRANLLDNPNIDTNAYARLGYLRSQSPSNPLAFGQSEDILGLQKLAQSAPQSEEATGLLGRLRQGFDNLKSSVGDMDSRFSHHARAILELVVIYRTLETAISTVQQVFSLQSQLSEATAHYSIITGESTEASQRNVIALQQQAAAYGILPEQVDQGAAGIAQYTKNLKEQQEVAASAAALSRLSGETFAQSVDRLTAALQANNLTAADSGRILDLVLTMYRAVPSTIEEDIKVVEKLGAAAGRTGMGLESVSLLAARVAQRAATTPTGAANIIERIPGALETQQALQGMIQYGISPFVSGTTQLRPFVDVLSDIAAKYNQLNAAGQTSQANRLVESIIGNRPEALRGFVAVLEEINQKMPPIVQHVDALNTAMDTTISKVDLIKTHWEQLLQDMGKTPEVNGVLDAIDAILLKQGQLATVKTDNGGVQGMYQSLGAGVRAGVVSQWDVLGVSANMSSLSLPDMIWGYMRGVNSGQPYRPPQTVSSGIVPFQTAMNEPPYPTGSNYTDSTAGTGTSGGNYLQGLYNAGVGSTGFLSLVNQTAISQQQFNDLQARSIQMTNRQMALWKEYLLSIGFTNDAAEEHLLKLRQAADVASVLVNVEGRAQLVTGPAANQFSAAYSQMNQKQEGFQRLNFGESYLPLYDQLVQQFRSLLSQVGLNEQGVPTVEAVGKDQVTLLRQSLFYQQASSMALAEIERLTKEHATGLYNFPRGYTPYVPYQSGDLDVMTRVNSNAPSASGIRVQPDPTVQALLSPFGAATTTFSNAVTAFVNGVATMNTLDDLILDMLRQKGITQDQVPSNTGSGVQSLGRRTRGEYSLPENPDYGLTQGGRNQGYHETLMVGRMPSQLQTSLQVTVPIQNSTTIVIGDQAIETITRQVSETLKRELSSNLREGQSDYGLTR